MAMRFFFLLLACGLLSGCNTYYQVFEVKTPQGAENLSFRNDTLQIDYDFWADRGQISYTLRNHSGRTLYVLQEASALLINGEVYPYIQCAPGTMGPAETRGGNHYWVIPAGTNASFTCWLLWPYPPDKFSTLAHPKYIQRERSLAQVVGHAPRVCYYPQTEAGSPLHFSNHMVFTFDPGQDRHWVQEYPFYLAQVLRTHRRNFLAPITAYATTSPDQSPFRARNRFYLCDSSQEQRGEKTLADICTGIQVAGQVAMVASEVTQTVQAAEATRTNSGAHNRPHRNNVPSGHYGPR